MQGPLPDTSLTGTHVALRTVDLAHCAGLVEACEPDTMDLT